MISHALHIAAPLVLAAFGACAPGPPPAVHFAYRDKPPVFYSGHTTAELRRIAPTLTTVNLRDFPVTSGVTEGKIGLETSLLFKSQEQLEGGYCLWPESLDVTLTYQAQVSIAKEYKPASCRYAETKAHELRHVAADEDAIHAFLPGLEGAAAEAAARLGPEGPFSLQQREAAKDRLLESVKTSLAQALEKLDSARNLRQRAIDTPAEYMRLSRACPGERLR